ncbi:MAG TPA: glycosyltransferase family 2 protein, partial [Thermomonospora sp.]|nr:glycosyltransferase family 2 protein [Thermomonospora sp.]
TLLLAEPADGGWRASLDGGDLAGRRVDGWAQAYEIPASGGFFELRRSMTLRHAWVLVQGVAVVVVAALALPGSRSGALPVRSRARRPLGRRARRVQAPAAEPPSAPAETPVTAGDRP